MLVANSKLCFTCTWILSMTAAFLTIHLGCTEQNGEHRETTYLSRHAGSVYEHICVVLRLIWLHAVLSKFQVRVEGLHIGDCSVMISPNSTYNKDSLHCMNRLFPSFLSTGNSHEVYGSWKLNVPVLLRESDSLQWRTLLRKNSFDLPYILGYMADHLLHGFCMFFVFSAFQEFWKIHCLWQFCHGQKIAQTSFWAEKQSCAGDCQWVLQKPRSALGQLWHTWWKYVMACEGDVLDAPPRVPCWSAVDLQTPLLLQQIRVPTYKNINSGLQQTPWEKSKLRDRHVQGHTTSGVLVGIVLWHPPLNCTIPIETQDCNTWEYCWPLICAWEGGLQEDSVDRGLVQP